MTSQSSARVAPGGFPVVGIIGGGQLARMMAPPAVGLSITLSVLSEAEDSSAALVVPDSPVGDYRSVDEVVAWARGCDIVTFDHEHVPTEVIRAVHAAGVAVEPRPEALVHAQDKLVMRRRLTELGIPCPRWAQVRTRDELARFGDQVGWPLVLKTPRGGYDGKGVLVVGSLDEASAWLDEAATAIAAAATDGSDLDTRHPLADGLLAEEAVGFRRELAVLVARSRSGQAAVWPVVETVQTDGICTEVIAPAPDLDESLSSQVCEAALRIAGELDVTGVMAVELFELETAEPGDGGEGGRPSYVVNELAMRPHNSGHWTIDGAVTSQFEQHLRAVLDLPLGSTRPRSRWTVMGNVLGGDYPELYRTYLHLMARDPEMKFHLYGKGVRPGRKIGHVDVSGDDLADLRERAQHACDYLQGKVTE